jgi:hypothetical protein
MPFRPEKLKDVLTTQGDILIRNALGPVRLGYGTNRQILKTSGIGANPAWAWPLCGHFLFETRLALGTASIYCGVDAKTVYNLVGPTLGTEAQTQQRMPLGITIDEMHVAIPTAPSMFHFRTFTLNTDTASPSACTVTLWNAENTGSWTVGGVTTAPNYRMSINLTSDGAPVACLGCSIMLLWHKT